MNVANTNVTIYDSYVIEDNFLLTIGTQKIQYQPLGYQNRQYLDMFTLSYENVFDPNQPQTGVITYAFQCPSILAQCSSLKNNFQIDGLTRIKNQWAFDNEYSVNVTISNKNTKYLKSSVDQVKLYQASPEYSGQRPEDCVDFTLNFRNLNYTVNRLSYTESLIIYDNLNFTDLKLIAPTVNISRCQQSYGSNIAYLAAINQNNPSLFIDPRTFLFNTTDIIISRAKLSSVLMTNSSQKIMIYVFIYSSAVNQLLGYYAHTLTLQKNDQTLYALMSLNFIQVDRDKVLYIDGGTSYDTRNSEQSFTYKWGIDGYTNLSSIPSQKILTLTPEQRNSFGLNTAGKYYTFSLQIIDSTRASNMAKITVQISPETDPKGCYQVSLKDIDLETIITYTVLPLMLQAKVVKSSTCTSAVATSLVWETQSVDWQFWSNFGNNNTIAIDRDTLTLLPKNQNIYMSVTQFYTVSGIEYIARKTFILFVAKPDLIPIVTYPRVINLRERTLIINATQSYDPQAVATGTTDVPVLCKWTCPSYLTSICSKATFATNNCLVNFPSSIFLTASNYATQIMNQAHLFTLNITKDSRVNTAYIYVTIIDSNTYPKCQIDFLKQITVNQYAFLNVTCFNQSSNQVYQYEWKIFSWKSFVRLDLISEVSTKNNQILRIPPYTLNDYEDVLIQLTVTNSTSVTPIYWYQKVNIKSGFVTGSLTKNFNQFTAYLSNFVMTPANWDSTVSQQLRFQYRMKVTDYPYPQYKVLMSPTLATASTPISTILPPITYENIIYYDVLDSDNNYLTVKQSILSQTDVIMSAATFQSKVNQIITSVIYTFNEADFEQNIIKLMLYYQAFRQSQVNMTGVPDSYFKSLSESTVNYLYNVINIDKRLTSTLSKDRAILVKQNIISILSFIAVKNQDISNQATFVLLLNFIVSSGDYYIGNSFDEISMKIYQSVVLINQYSYQALGDTILNKLQAEIQGFIFQDESLKYSSYGYQFISYEIATSINSLPQIDGFVYPQQLIFLSKFVGGTITMLRNDTFVLAQIYDSKQVPQLIQGLTIPVTINFQLSSDQIAKNISKQLTFQCGCRQDNSQSWSTAVTRIVFSSFDTTTGIVQCKSYIMGQFALFINDLTLKSQNTTGVVILPNSTSDQNISGQWNSSVPDDGQYLVSFEDQYVFYEEKVVFQTIASLTLVFFVLSSYAFHWKYKKEHQEMSITNFANFEILLTQSLTKNRCRLFIKIMINFNPYLNLFMVYNKFLKRWVRNSLLQIYFMTISLIYGINASLLSIGYSDLGKTYSSQLIALFIIVLFIVLLGRPLAIKAMYKLLYEPDAKVEDFYEYTSQPNFNKEEMGVPPRIVNFDLMEDDLEKKDAKFVLPRMFEKELDLTDHKRDPIVIYDSSMNISARSQDDQHEEELPNKIEIDLGLAKKPEYFSELPPINSHRVNLENQGPPQLSLPEIKNKKFQKKRNTKQALRMNNNFNSDYENQDPNLYQLKVIPDLPSQEDQSEESKLQDKIDRTLDYDDKQQSINNSKNQSLRDQNIFKLPEINLSSRKNQFMMFKDNILEQSAQLKKQNTVDPNYRPHTSVQSNNTQPKLSQEAELNYFDQFYDPNDSPQQEDQLFEGGEDESLEEIEQKPRQILQDQPSQRNSHEDQQNTMLYPTHILHSNNYKDHEDEGHQHTEFLKYQDMDNSVIKAGQNTNLSIKQQDYSNDLNRKDSFNNTGRLPKHFEEESQLVDENKKYFLNKHIGKAILLIIWVGLAVGNILCIENMRRKHFISWLILSLVTFFVIIFIIDPILYYVLSSFMIKNQQSRKPNYFIRKLKKRDFASIFVLLLIGNEKMRDLRRYLNPQIYAKNIANNNKQQAVQNQQQQQQ